VTGPFAHVGGLPVEEMLPAVAPAVAAMAYMSAGLRAWLRRR
jgi:hypothetical protein